jgi:hypothetical protein
MESTGYYILFLISGFLSGIGFIYFLLRTSNIIIYRLDEKTLLLRLPLLGTIEVKGPERYSGIFVKNVSETLDKLKAFQRMMDFDLMLRYAREYNINYIGLEGDEKDGSWSRGRLAYSTLSKGYSGGYDIYLNPGLDRETVCRNLKEEIEVDIRTEELHTFLFLHEIGHTCKAGNESYIAAKINHHLAGKKRKRWKDIQTLYRKVEKFADDFAIQELLKLREKGLN